MPISRARRAAAGRAPPGPRRGPGRDRQWRTGAGAQRPAGGPALASLPACSFNWAARSLRIASVKASPAEPPNPKDKETYAKAAGLKQQDLDFSDFTKKGFWNVDDVLRPIFKDASEALGQEFPYPERKK